MSRGARRLREGPPWYRPPLEDDGVRACDFCHGLATLQVFRQAQCEYLVVYRHQHEDPSSSEDVRAKTHRYALDSEYPRGFLNVGHPSLLPSFAIGRLER